MPDPYDEFEWLKRDYAEFSDGQKQYFIFKCCYDGLMKWKEFNEQAGELNFVGSDKKTPQKVDVQLLFDAFESAKYLKDLANAEKRFIEPINALKNQRLIFPVPIFMRYFAVYNLFRRYVYNEDIEDWLIIGQATADDDFWGTMFPYYEKLMIKVREYEFIPNKF